MKKILYLIPLFALCLVCSSCSKKEIQGHLTITGDSTVFQPHRLKSYHRIAQEEKIVINLHVITDSIFTINQLMAEKASIPIFKENKIDAAITYFRQANMVLVETSPLLDVPMQKGLAKKLFCIQIKNQTLPGYQAIDSVMHIIAQAKHETQSLWGRGLSIFSNVRDDLQWVLSPSDRWFFQILFRPAYELCLLTIRLFHSLRWPIIIFIFLYVFLSFFKIFIPEARFLCKVLRTLVLISLVYVLLFCSPSLDNLLYGEHIRDILYTSYISSQPQGRAIGWGIGIIVLLLLDHFRKLLIASAEDLKEGEFVSTRKDLEIQKFSGTSLAFASVFVLPKILLQVVCLVVGCMLLTNIVEDVQSFMRSEKKDLLFDKKRYSDYAYWANLLIILYFAVGFFFFFKDLIAVHQPWAWLQNDPAMNIFYGLIVYTSGALSFVLYWLVPIDFCSSQAQCVNLLEKQNKNESVTSNEIHNALVNLGKDFLTAFVFFVVIVLSIYLILRYNHV